MNDNYKLQDNLMDKIDPYFLSQDNSFSDWNKWNLVSFLEYVDERKTLSFSDKREIHRRFGDSISAILKSDAPATMKEAIKDLKKEVRVRYLILLSLFSSFLIRFFIRHVRSVSICSGRKLKRKRKLLLQMLNISANKHFLN